MNDFPLLALLLAPVLVVLAIIIYRLTLHPLARYPGPFLAKITAWYNVYHAYNGDKHLNYHRLHKKYGTFVRYSPNGLSVNHPAALKAIYAGNTNVKKSHFYSVFPATPTAISTLLAIDKPFHARKRRIISQAFSDTALKAAEQYVLQHTRTFTSKLYPGDAFSRSPINEKQSDWSEARDLSKWTAYLGFDIILDLTFGSSSGGALDGNMANREAIHMLQRAAKRNYVTAAMPALQRTGIEKYLPGFRSLYLDRSRFLAFGKKTVQDRAKDSSFFKPGRRDIFSYLLHAKDPETGEGLSKPELFMEGTTLIVAGSDTSSTTLSATFWYLLRDPSALARLTDEIRATFTDVEEIRAGVQLQSCTYLRACIDETLRMSPPISGLLPRTILRGGLRVLDHDFPEGVDIGVPIYAVQHHADYIAKPFTWAPSRWLQCESGGVEQDKQALLACFNPFSIGIRGCVGKPLAYLELGLAVARTLFLYDVRLAQDGGRQHLFAAAELGEPAEGRRNPDEYQMRDYFVSQNEGPLVEFRPRQGL